MAIEEKIRLTELAYPDILAALAEFNSMDNNIEVLNSMTRAMGAGSDDSRVQDVYYGINKLPQLPALPHHIENQGLVFFTRPELNLSYDNIANVRKLALLLTGSNAGEANSYAHAVKCALDPITQRDSNNKVQSKLIDSQNPYLTYFTNLCTTMSQPPDIAIQTFTTPEGMQKEQWMVADGVADHNGYYDITCTFAGMQGNPVLWSIYCWLYYIHHLRMGPCIPHPVNRIQNRMDYFTRLERFTFEPDGKTISNWWHCGAALPKNLSIGSIFGYNKLENYNETKDLTVQFGCVGSIINDPIQLFEFNIRMMQYNPMLAEDRRASKYIRVHPSDYGITNYYGYPLINLNTREMDWWMEPRELERMLKGQRPAEDAKMYAELRDERNSVPPRYNPFRI